MINVDEIMRKNLYNASISLILFGGSMCVGAYLGYGMRVAQEQKIIMEKPCDLNNYDKFSLEDRTMTISCQNKECVVEIRDDQE